jgi:hypothetical protein
VLKSRLSRTLAGVLLLAALAPASAAAVSGPPNIHTPKLFSDPSDWGGLLTVNVGNSDEVTSVVACVSSRCVRVFPSSVEPFPSNDNVYTATGRDFGLVFERGQRRTVVVFAANGSSDSRWGPEKITVR